MTQSCWRLSFKATPEKAALLESAIEITADTFATSPPTLSYFELDEREGFDIDPKAIWLFEIFFSEKPPTPLITEILERAGLSDVETLLENIPDQDWVSISQKLLQPVHAGRIVVYGAHDKDVPNTAEIAIQLEAGQAFGTGQHETTAGCLLSIDKLRDTLSPQRILDVGTGSGVLAMVAAKAWDARILATDIDPISIDTAHYNITLNAINIRQAGDETSGIALKVATGLDDPIFKIDGPFDLIIANILSGPLIDLAADITAALAPKGIVILAGLLSTQESNVLAAYQQRGLYIHDRIEQNGWPTLVLQKA